MKIPTDGSRLLDQRTALNTAFKVKVIIDIIINSIKNLSKYSIGFINIKPYNSKALVKIHARDAMIS